MARLSIGGGKGVIMKPKGEFDRKALFEAYGRAVDTVNGTYITAEDVGVSPEDMAIIRTQTPHVAGLPDTSGDPSPVTAEGVFRGIKVAARRVFGSDDLSYRRVAVQGLGHVGYALAEHLAKAGAGLFVADIDEDVLDRARTQLGARVIRPDAIHAQDADIFAPCALGGAINAKTLPQISAKIVAGAANNQLATPDMAEALDRLGILYAPDYVINAGGIINVDAEVSHPKYDPKWVKRKLVELEDTLELVFARAEETKQPTISVANEIARERLAERRDWR
jgi:leucine dehydrogenase